MRLVAQIPASEGSKRQIPAAVRVSPDLLSRLCSHLIRSMAAQAETAGLLFGVVEEDVVSLSAFRSFQAGMEDLPGKERLDRMFRHLRAASHNDPEISRLELVGWFSLREQGGLAESDVEFHNKHFQRAADIAVVVRSEGEPNALFEFYSRVDERPLSRENYRWASLRMDLERPISGVIDVALHPKLSAPLESAEPIESPRELLNSARQLARTGVGRVPARRVQAGAPPGLPAVRKEKRRVPWISSAVIFAIAAAVTFASFYTHTTQSGGEAPLFLQALFPNATLGLRAEGEGDRVLLSWNRRNPIVRAAKGGLLRIDDGSQHRKVHLDAAQVDNGAVLYRPDSDDVVFQLEVYGQQGATLTESMRVLDGAKTRLLERQDAPTDLSGPAIAKKGQPSQTGSQLVTTTRNSDARSPRADRGRNVMTPGSAQQPAGGQEKQGKNTIQSQPETQPAASTTTVADTAVEDLAGRTGETPKSRTTNTASASAPDAESLSSSKGGPRQEKFAAGQSTPGQSTPNALSPISAPANRSSSQSSSTTPLEGTPVADTASQTLGMAAVGSRAAPTFVPPRPIRQVLPNIRFLGAVAIRTTPQVEVNVKVNKKGRVVDARVVNTGPKMRKSVADSAANAARQWAFQPATINGRAVESYHTIVFEFRPESR